MACCGDSPLKPVCLPSDHYLGDEAEALGDVESYSKLESPQPLAGSGYGWLGGRFHLGIMGWLPVSQYLACYNAQFPCQFGQQHPCCGNTRDSTHLWEQMIEAASVDLKVFRRGPLPEGSEVRDHQNHMEESNSRFGDLRERIWSEDARSPWDPVAQEIFELDEINPVIDSRAQDWATLSDDSMSPMRCETHGLKTTTVAAEQMPVTWAKSTDLYRRVTSRCPNMQLPGGQSCRMDLSRLKPDASTNITV